MDAAFAPLAWRRVGERPQAGEHVLLGSGRLEARDHAAAARTGAARPARTPAAAARDPAGPAPRPRRGRAARPAVRSRDRRRPSKIGARDVVRLDRHEHLQVDARHALEPALQFGAHERPVEHEPQVAAQPGLEPGLAAQLRHAARGAERRRQVHAHRAADQHRVSRIDAGGLGRCSTSTIAQMRGTSTNLASTPGRSRDRRSTFGRSANSGLSAPRMTHESDRGARPASSSARSSTHSIRPASGSNAAAPCVVDDAGFGDQLGQPATGRAQDRDVARARRLVRHDRLIMLPRAAGIVVTRASDAAAPAVSARAGRCAPAPGRPSAAPRREACVTASSRARRDRQLRGHADALRSSAIVPGPATASRRCTGARREQHELVVGRRLVPLERC